MKGRKYYLQKKIIQSRVKNIYVNIGKYFPSLISDNQILRKSQDLELMET